jgi:hypothetical protein
MSIYLIILCCKGPVTSRAQFRVTLPHRTCWFEITSVVFFYQVYLQVSFWQIHTLYCLIVQFKLQCFVTPFWTTSFLFTFNFTWFAQAVTTTGDIAPETHATTKNRGQFCYFVRFSCCLYDNLLQFIAVSKITANFILISSEVTHLNIIVNS